MGKEGYTINTSRGGFWPRSGLGDLSGDGAGKKCRDPYLYEACELPHWYAPEQRFTRRGHMVFLRQLLSGVESGFQQLEKLPRSTRYRYLARMRRFMQNRARRPLVA
jgi:hypothetical protein